MTDNSTLPAAGDIVEDLDTFGVSGVHSKRQVITVSPRDLSGADSIGGLTETPPATDIASSGLNGRLARIAQRISSLITALATLSAVTATSNALDINLKSGGTPTGTGADLAGALVTFTNEGKAQLGSITETAPASDTASSGLNGRLQRVAQRLTSILAALLPTATANGATSSRINSAATTNATNLKASAGQGYEIDVFNNAAYTVFLKFYNKASAPTVGTDTPIWTIPVQAGGGYSRAFKYGKTFSTGIAYAITKLQADTDTTAVAAGDLTGSIDWI